MKKIILLLACAAYLFACKDTGTSTQGTRDDDTLTAAEWEKYPQLAKTDVESMVKYYFEIKKNDTNIIRGISFDNPPLRKLLHNKQRMSIYMGAYITDSPGKKKGDVILIIQLKEKDKFTYYDYNSIFPKNQQLLNAHCPPPYNAPCPLEEN